MSAGHWTRSRTQLCAPSVGRTASLTLQLLRHPGLQPLHLVQVGPEGPLQLREQLVLFRLEGAEALGGPS